MNKMSQKRLVASLMEAYVSWRETCLRVNDAYGAWGSGAEPDAACAFGVYMAALDQEQRAAEVYGELVRRAAQLTYGNDERLRVGTPAQGGL